MHLRRLICCLIVVLVSLPAVAQQTGSITGRVTASDGSALPGVTVEAKSDVLPQPRVTTTDSNGDYQLPALQPGVYTLTFTLAGMETATRRADALLGQATQMNVKLGVQGVAESITVTAESTLVDQTSTALKSGLSQNQIRQLPSGQEYRDLLKLAPGIQVNDAEIRGPSAGGSEQDNVYNFDGVNVTLPLFGTLAAEPATHDIAQVSIIKGGAKAVDFIRSAGFTVDSVSKSGTAQWKGEATYQFQTDGMTAPLTNGSLSKYDENKAWASGNVGGPILRDRLFFFGSAYHPTRGRDNSSNLYGTVPNFDSTRSEYFGKLTATPTAKILLNASYRTSKRTNENASVGSSEAATAAVGEKSEQTIGIVEGSWVVTDRSVATFKYNDYGLKTSSRPDLLLDVVPSAAIGAQLDINNLDQMGYFNVPIPRTGTTPSDLAFNAFVAPIISKYGYVNSAGARVGGGFVGGAPQVNDQDFYRQAGQVGYDLTLGQKITHDLHVGYMQSKEQEDLARFSNGWGALIVQGGRVNCTIAACNGQPIFFQTDFQRSTEGSIGKQVINSQYHSKNIEFNDTIKWGSWAFNVGVLASKDTLYGEGLAKADNIAGFVASPGTRYKQYELDWDKQIQPRLGATWTYNGSDTVYASYARYVPAVSSLPRAAAWDRNTLGLVVRAYFDAAGKLIGSEQVASSSGKLFEPDLDPRYTDEFMIGTAQQFNSRWSGRAYGRYRFSTNFWEDTNNAARVNFKAPGDIALLGPYIPNLGTNPSGTTPGTGLRGAIGSGSSYVIAELDGAFTKYYEATFETDYHYGNANLTGTYTWSHYYGNFDQDNTSTTYDFATFLGSSNIADGGGRQIWNYKYGDLHGDRRHLLKMNGYYNLPWHASVGAVTFFQSGHAWEAWSWEPYGPNGENVIGTNTSDTNRYAEPAGRRRTADHYQLDLKYTQNFHVVGMNLQVIGDLYNVFNKQTGYSPQPAMHLASFGVPRIFMAPRRLQLSARLQF
jgi:hypothetical protein